jgi:hypothetical protein
MSSCRDSRDNTVGTSIPSSGVVVAGIFPVKGIPPTATARAAARQTKTARIAPSIPEPWPPDDLALPDTIEEIEAGHFDGQRQLPADDGRAGRAGGRLHLFRQPVPGSAR